ncbi:MAG: methyl-accepting chemotaxis protein [Venatoribacter sp.]
MHFLASLSIKTKILSLTLVAVIGFVTSLLINHNMNTANTLRLSDIQQIYFPAVEESKANIVRLARIEELFSTAVSSGEMDFVKSAEVLRGEILEGTNKLEALWPKYSQEAKQIRFSFENYFKAAKELSVGMIDDSLDMNLLSSKIEGMNSALKLARSDMESYSDTSLNAFNSTVETSNKEGKEAQSLSLILALVILAIMLGAAFTISYFINASLASLLSSLKNIASGQGDLTQRIQKHSDDEIGQVVDSFNQFVEKLHTNIGELVKNTQPLTSITSDLRSLTNSTSRIAEEQNMATEQVAIVVDGMLESMRDVSSHANSAAAAAQEADEAAKQGRIVVNETVVGINNLAEAIDQASEVIRKLEADTNNVAGILDVIRGIAEQTNLLALNAAIEAARAGEQGRGFAVVADEVRTLASRTQDSTTEIQGVIEQLQQASQSAVKVMDRSKDQAGKSVTQASQTDESLQRITNHVEAIRSMNSQIASNIENQEQAATGIKHHLSGIQSTSEETVRSIQKVDGAGQSLTGIANSLQYVTGQFRV